MRNDKRAVSEVLGYALVFSLVITTVAIVTVSGLGQLQDTRDNEQLNNAERAFDLLSTNMDDIAKRGAPSRSTEIRLTEAQLDVTNPITVSFEGEDTGNPTANNFSESYEVWPIIYRSSNSDSAVVYSAGAVFRTQSDSGVAVQEPSLVASNDRVVVPLILTRSRNTQSLAGGTTRIRATRSDSSILVSDVDGTYEDVYMNITSPRAEIWNRTLSDYDAFDCQLNTTSTPNRADCHAENPQRVHISLIKIDFGVAD